MPDASATPEGESGVAVVTGASRGLGAALGGELARRRFALGLCALSQPAESDSVRSVCRGLDVADPSAVEDFAAEVHDRLGPIDLWINNAGVLGPIGPLRGARVEDWARCVEINLLGTVAGSRSFLAHRSPDAMLVNIASRAGLQSAAGLAAYSATKAAVVSLTRAISDEEAGTGVRAFVIIPPSIDTDMQTTLLAQDPARFPGVAVSRARRDAGGVVAAVDAAKAIVDAVLDTRTEAPVVDLTDAFAGPK